MCLCVNLEEESLSVCVCVCVCVKVEEESMIAVILIHAGLFELILTYFNFIQPGLCKGGLIGLKI